MGKWYESEITKPKPRNCKPPYDNIWIGPTVCDGFSLEDAKSFHAIVNVADSFEGYFDPAYPGQYMHWYPINEVGYWGYAPFYWFKNIMDFHYSKGHKVYVHCMAGAYRSPTMVEFWLKSQGLSNEEVWAITHKKLEEKDRDWLESHFTFPFRMGNAPKKVEEFLTRIKGKEGECLAEALCQPNSIEDTEEVWGAYLKNSINQKRFKYYYAAKSFIKDKVYDFKRYLIGQYKVQENSWCYSYKQDEKSFWTWFLYKSPTPYAIRAAWYKCFNGSSWITEKKIKEKIERENKENEDKTISEKT